jgi:uncharacterized SAM-binding protein YcdF (DUF218 family)
MFFILSKILPNFVYPVSLLFIALLGILIFYQRRQARRVLLGVMVVFYGLSIPVTATSLMRWLEGPYRTPGDLRQKYDTIIVLSGMLHLQQSQPGRLEFNDAVDRVLTGVALLKQGRGETLLLAGGSGMLLQQDISEAVLLRDFVIELGLQPQQILLDTTSRNTYENAVNSAAIVRAHHYQHVLLVTSAAHMRRSLAAFHQQGISPDPYPVDIRTGELEITPFSFIPSADSLAGTTEVIREVFGLVAYRLQGYI